MCEMIEVVTAMIEVVAAQDSVTFDIVMPVVKLF